MRFDHPSEAAFTAVGEGDAKIDCETGKIVLQVRRVARLEIDGPASVAKDTKVIYDAIGYDARGERLDLGDDVAWEIEGPAHETHRCMDMLGICLGASSRPLVTDGAGTLRLRVKAGGAEGVRVISIEP